MIDNDVDSRLLEEKLRKLVALGDRPPWWRIFARRKYDRRRAEISAMDVSVFAAMLRELYPMDAVTEMAARASLHDTVAFGSIRKVGPPYRVAYAEPTKEVADALKQQQERTIEFLKTKANT